ncbi:MAG: GGDEF domain-containing protein [Gammaproteobacteria bacterium]|nr:GGDEF domain-containing protein [Gammaproteobacteria bacterium]
MNINEKILYAQLNALVELTNQTSIEDLVDVFVKNITVIFPSKSILLITSHGPKALNRLAFTSKNLGGTVLSLIERIGSLDSTNMFPDDLRAKTIINENEKSNWVQIPINTNIGTVGFVQIAGVHTEKSIFQAEAHIRTFINQVILLSLNERDALTRLYNRSAFHEKLASLLKPVPHQRKSDVARQYVLAFLQIDQVEQIIEQAQLDNVLILISRIITSTFREYDWGFRYDTEAFAIILHECDRDLGALALGRLLKRIQEFDFPTIGQISCSIGFVQLDRNIGFDNIVDQALQAMQQAHILGGNRFLGHVNTH